MLKIVIFVFLLIAIAAGWMIAHSVIAPDILTDMGIKQVNSPDEPHGLRASSSVLSYIDIVFVLTTSVFSVLFWKKSIMKGLKSMKESISATMFLILVALLLTGCMPYEEPEYAIVETHETAFVVPLEGDTGKQAKFDSVEQLEAAKVATKRIRIVKRWDKTGYWYRSGMYIPLIRVIKVNRSPVTQEWISHSADDESGNGIWVESRDSVGFSTGFSVTARIEEPDAATYLYKYRGDQLSEVMNREIRARVQKIAAEVSARYNMDELREKKQEILDKIEEDVVPFFERGGITITTIGMFGGFAYENPEIQQSIDAVFVSQQLKEINAAKLKAQTDENARLKMEGEGEASKVKEVAIGKADAIVTVAEAEAKAITLISDASAQVSDGYLENKRLDVSTQIVERWNGSYPQFMMGQTGGAGGPDLMMMLPQKTSPIE